MAIRKQHSPFASRDAEIAKLRAEVTELRQEKHLTHFAREVGNNIMTMLANTPYDKWPDFAKIAFDYAARRQTTTAHMYIQRLPK